MEALNLRIENFNKETGELVALSRLRNQQI